MYVTFFRSPPSKVVGIYGQPRCPVCLCVLKPAGKNYFQTFHSVLIHGQARGTRGSSEAGANKGCFSSMQDWL